NPRVHRDRPWNRTSTLAASQVPALPHAPSGSRWCRPVTYPLRRSWRRARDDGSTSRGVRSPHAFPPVPRVWTTTNALLATHGPLGPVWAAVPGNGERVLLLDLAA